MNRSTMGGPDATASGFRRNKRFFTTAVTIPNGRSQSALSQPNLLSLRDPDVVTSGPPSPSRATISERSPVLRQPPSPLPQNGGEGWGEGFPDKRCRTNSRSTLMRTGFRRSGILYQCAFKQVIKSTDGQAGGGTQETDLTLLIAHWYEKPGE